MLAAWREYRIKKIILIHDPGKGGTLHETSGDYEIVK